MENSEELTSILINLQKKYNVINEIFNLTKEMEKAVQTSDNVALSMILDMRQDNMEAVDRLDNLNSQIKSFLDNDTRNRLNFILSPEADSPEEEKSIDRLIFDANRRIISLVKQIIVIDNVLKKKISVNQS